MSTMLKTTNPEAVNEIDPNRDRRVPYVGQSLIFHMRSGEGRAGKMTAAAICTQVEDEDHVELLVIFAADDFITRWKIPRKTEQNNTNCWAFNAYDELHYRFGMAPDPFEIWARERITELERRLDDLEQPRSKKLRTVTE